MINDLYKTYFQKSRAFIYPLVNISKKAAFSPTMTYFSWKGVHIANEQRLIAIYDVDVTSEKWLNFLHDVLYKNPFFEDYSHTEDHHTAVVVFDMRIRKSSYEAVILGKYSQVPADMRSLILVYYGYNTQEWAYIETFLLPGKYFKQYAKLLDTDVEVLEAVGELCDIPDMTKECLILETHRNYSEKIS